MTERLRLTNSYSARQRSQSCRDGRERVTRTASELHRQIVDRAQRRFEQQLAKSEHELNWAMRRRRDLTASSTEKRQANECLRNLRTTLNQDYTQLIQTYVDEHKEKVEQLKNYTNRPRYEESPLERPSTAQRNIKEEVHVAPVCREKLIDQIVRERDAICEEKLAAQKSFYIRLLDEQAQRLRHEQPHRQSGPSIPNEQLSLAQLKGRLARMEYEHRELKQLVFDLRSDLSSINAPPPTFRNTIRIPNFPVKP